MSISKLRDQIKLLLQERDCSIRVAEVLYNKTAFTPHEDYCWDFKEVTGLEGLEKSSSDYEPAICQIVKDIAAFYNTFGGYIIFGVDDRSRRLVGVTCDIPVEDIVRRIKSSLDAPIDFNVTLDSFHDHPIGILCVIGRSRGTQPVAFRKDAKAATSGKVAYKTHDIYYRDGIGSTPAKGDILIDLIAGTLPIPGERVDYPIFSLTDHNLPARDPSFINFIGRDNYLDALWRWLLDPFMPAKLVSGVGGVGKTTLVREFAETVLTKSPLKLEKIIWLSAKKAHFRAVEARTELTRDDDPNLFVSPIDLYRKIISHLGLTDAEIADLSDDQEFIVPMTNALKITPSLVIVDDLDSLGGEDQVNVFQTLSVIFSRTTTLAKVASRCLMTARLNLGAAISQRISLSGFSEPEFYLYITNQARQFGFSLSLKRDSRLFQKFFNISGGSPLFASSILRLVNDGKMLDQALQDWRGRSGEDVRLFAFQKEIGQLSNSSLRCLFAIIQISPCSLLEIIQVTESSEQTVVDDLSALREFNLVSRGSDVAIGGKEYAVDSNISLINELVRTRLIDPNRILVKCKEVRSAKKSRSEDVAMIIGQVVALWREESYDAALEYIMAQKKRRGGMFHPDLECVLGRALLRVTPPRLADADAAFMRAYDNGSQRPELLDLWIECRQTKEDWRGAVELCTMALKDRHSLKYIFELGSSYLAYGTTLAAAGDFRGAINELMSGGRQMNDYIASTNLEGYFPSINVTRRRCFEEALSMARSTYATRSTIIEVWEVFWKGFECFVRTGEMIRVGLVAIGDWADYVVKFRDKVTRGDIAKAEEAISRLSAMQAVFSEKKWTDESVVELASNTEKSLANVRLRLIERFDAENV